MLHDWGSVLAQQVVDGSPRPPDPLAARVVAQSAMAALQEAICMWWQATGHGPSLVALTTEALRLAVPARARQSRIA
jgi:hypothetical protein